jgi:hypothetical protein
MLDEIRTFVVLAEKENDLRFPLPNMLATRGLCLGKRNPSTLG